MNKFTGVIGLCGGLGWLASCATARPPQELLDARAAYSKAEQGPAAKYKPDQLHEARVALDRAEQQFKDDPDSQKTVNSAYVAERRAQYADVEGATAQFTDQKNQAYSDLTHSQAAGLQQAQGELNKTREQLTLEQQQLATEQQARAAAEARAKDAMDKLALASVPVKQETRGTVITLPGSVLFASNKSTLLSSAEDKLNQVAGALKDQEDHQITVEGYTDSRGSDELNQSLSQARAESVRSYLVAQGFPSDHITAVGLGSSRPVADNKSAEGRANNRRVEIIIKPIEPK